MELNFKEFGQGEPVVILHGLFGTLDNWQTVARQLAENYSVFLLDQRNHGRSPHTQVHDYQSMAEDLREFMEAHWLYGAHLVGHSMGGKTAMQFALEHPDMVNKLVVVDIAPKAYPERHQHIFEALFALDLDNLKDRQQAEDFLADRIPDLGERQFLMKNLSRKTPSKGQATNPLEGAGAGGFELKMNLEVIHRHYPDILAAIESDHAFEKPALFIRGELSRHIQAGDEAGILKLFPQAKIETVAGAGHWVHADKPAELLKLILDFLAI